MACPSSRRGLTVSDVVPKCSCRNATTRFNDRLSRPSAGRSLHRTGAGACRVRTRGYPDAALPSAEMLREEFFHRFVEVKAVLLVLEAMPLVLLHHILDRDAALVQSGAHLIGFVYLDPRIVRPLRDEERRPDP